MQDEIEYWKINYTWKTGIFKFYDFSEFSNVWLNLMSHELNRMSYWFNLNSKWVKFHFVQTVQRVTEVKFFTP